MHDQPIIIFIALFIFIYGLFSRLSAKWAITGPMAFMSLGILASPFGFGLFDTQPSAASVKLIAEITLIMILFVDATMIKHHVLRHAPNLLPARLLSIGLPLTMLFGVTVAFFMFDDFNIWAIMLMAFILSPTDAALGQAVITSKNVPEEVRQAINVESGINDGIVLPPILCAMAFLAPEITGEHDMQFFEFMMLQLILGPLVGLGVGWIGGRLIERATQKGWMDHIFHQLVSFSLAILAFALAEYLQGNGFISAFCAGLALNIKNPKIQERIYEFGEAEGTLLSLGVFTAFGLVLVPIAYQYWGLWEIIYAVLSLTVIRMLPVAISLIGAKQSKTTVAFIGWFGPRGIASVLYLLLVINTIGFTGNEHFLSIIILTIAMSIIAHGLSAEPLTRLYKKTPSLCPSSLKNK